VSAREMSAEFALGFFPFTQRLRGRRQPGGQAERMQQPVGGERLKIFPVRLCRRVNSPLRSRTSFIGYGMACGAITSWFTALDEAAELA